MANVKAWGVVTASVMGWGALSCLGCASTASSTGEAEAPSSTDSAAAADVAAPEESAAPSEMKLAQAAAAQIASTWATERAAKDEVELTLRVRVGDMSAVVVGKGDGAYTLTGADAVNTKPDIVIDLAVPEAEQLAEGGMTLSQLKEAGKVTTDNDQGLDLFLTYTNAK